MAIKIDGKIVAGIGASGKSAYEHAKNGGYTGSETSFNQSLADINDYVTEDEMYTYVDETIGNIDFDNIPQINVLDNYEGEDLEILFPNGKPGDMIVITEENPNINYLTQTELTNHNINENAHLNIQDKIKNVENNIEKLTSISQVISETLDGSVSINGSMSEIKVGSSNMPTPSQPWSDFTISLASNQGFGQVSIQGKTIQVYTVGVNNKKAYANFTLSLSEDGKYLNCKCTNVYNPNSIWNSFPKTANFKITGVFKSPLTAPLEYVTKTEFNTEINSLKTSVSEGKSLIADAVTDKGIPTASDASFQTIANNINSIPIPLLSSNSILTKINSYHSSAETEYSSTVNITIPDNDNYLAIISTGYRNSSLTAYNNGGSACGFVLISNKKIIFQHSDAIRHHGSNGSSHAWCGESDKGWEISLSESTLRAYIYYGNVFTDETPTAVYGYILYKIT